MKGMRSQRGFTILETMVAAGVAGMALAIAAPSVSTALDGSRLQSAIRSTAQTVRTARAVAISRNQPSRVVVSGGGRVLAIEVQKGGSWVATGTPHVLDTGAAITAVSPSAGVLTFSNQGTLLAPATITVSGSSGSKQLPVSLLGVVGASS